MKSSKFYEKFEGDVYTENPCEVCSFYFGYKMYTPDGPRGRDFKNWSDSSYDTLE